MTRVRRTVRNALLAGLAVFLGLVPAGRDFVRGYAEGRSSDQTAILAEYGESTPSLGAIRFAYGDFGGINTDALRTNAMPWKVVAAALVLQARRDGEADRATLNRVLSGFGFIFPDTILNWTGPVRPRPFSRPLGIVTGYVERSVPRIKLEVLLTQIRSGAAAGGRTSAGRSVRTASRRDLGCGMLDRPSRGRGAIPPRPSRRVGLAR